MKTFGFRKGSHFSGDAEAVGAELERLQEAGPLTPSRIVRAASSKRSPLHRYFKWDDAEAAREYRLNQARKLVRAVVVSTEADQEPVSVFVHVPSPESGEGEYENREALVGSPDRYSRALRHLAEKVASAQRAFKEVEDLSREFDDEESVAIVRIAEKALGAATEAIRRLKAA